jgi:hypothetical protein
MAKAKYPIHPLAETYPPMDAAELEALTEDIRQRGLQRDIVLYEGKVLDGRNRLHACEQAGVEPRFVTYDGDDPLGQVNSLNLNRDLSASQRAVIAARQWLLKGDTHKEGGNHRKGTTIKNDSGQVAITRQFRISVGYLCLARDLLEGAEDLGAQVALGAMSLQKAEEKLEERQRETALKRKQMALVAEFKEAIEAGAMTLEEALAAIQERLAEEERARQAACISRRTWLHAFAEHLKWFETYLYPGEHNEYRPDGKVKEFLDWYTTCPLPGGKENGFHDNGVTADRIRDVLTGLKGAAGANFRGRKPDGSESGV